MKKINKKIRQSIKIAQRAQRNYDLSKSIPFDDLKTLIFAAKNSPSKQNETHYALHVYTDTDKIRKVYNCTKRFGLGSLHDNKIYKEINGKFWQNKEKSVHNSQILSNALFVYTDDIGDLRGGEHVLGQKNLKGTCAKTLQEQKSYSIGISIGELILSATMLGYRTGICSAFTKEIYNVIGLDKEIKVLVGIGYPNSDIDRKFHAETKNIEVPPGFETGLPHENWMFPSFEKKCKVYLNDTPYN